jgi:very-short-patch-repair endonuclease
VPEGRGGSQAGGVVRRAGWFEWQGGLSFKKPTFIFMPTHNRKYLKPYRQNLRSRLTPAEAFLWSYLKSKQLEGRKFRRQHSIENYIVDFYCPEEKIAIELDGQVHEFEMQHHKDKVRDLRLDELGIKVLRFENQFVFDQLPLVMEMIKAEFRK